MVNYREILRLTSLGYTQRQIAASVHSSRSTISEVPLVKYRNWQEKQIYPFHLMNLLPTKYC